MNTRLKPRPDPDLNREGLVSYDMQLSLQDLSQILADLPARHISAARARLEALYEAAARVQEMERHCLLIRIKEPGHA
jgi:hypothetical protein